MIAAVLTHVQKLQHRLGARPAWAGWRPREAAAVRAAPRTDRNPDALACYLFGILSPLPLVGLLFGVPAVVLGVRGLRHARRHPRAGDRLQCRIGISLGGIFSAVYLSISLFLVAVLVF